jgi:hypothetical protein
MEIDYLMIYMGLIPLAAGLYFVIRDGVHSRYGFHTEGKVEEVLGKWSTHRGKISYYYYPVIEFTPPEKEPKKLLMEVGSNFKMYSKGEKVKIVYYKNNITRMMQGGRYFMCCLR